MSCIVFVSKISTWGKGRFYIEIPNKVLEQYEELISKWYSEETPLVIEIKPLAGVHARIKTKL